MITIALWYLLIGGILALLTDVYATQRCTLDELVVMVALWPIVSLMVLFDVEISE